MISHCSIRVQLIPDSSEPERHRNSLLALPGCMSFNFKTWLRNRRELRNLDDDQLRDVGLGRKTVEEACTLKLLGQ
jgi:uncharacterized protein YjiS (DUF1127 family)